MFSSNALVVLSIDLICNSIFGVIGELARLRGLKLRMAETILLAMEGRVRIKVGRQFKVAVTRATSLDLRSQHKTRYIRLTVRTHCPDERYLAAYRASLTLLAPVSAVELRDGLEGQLLSRSHSVQDATQSFQHRGNESINRGSGVLLGLHWRLVFASGPLSAQI